MQRLVSVLAVTALAATATAQFTLVAPNGYAAVEGASNNAFPWNRATASMHFLQLYDSTHFTLQGVTSPILISRVKFRANATTATWAGGSWPNVKIDMSTAAVDFLAASPTFASNHGPDRTTVYLGAVTVAGGTGTSTTLPGPWYVDITLNTPFLYDPTSGNDLAFDVELDGTGWTGASTQTDAISGVAALPAAPLGTRVYFAGIQTNPTGTVGLHHMLTTEFNYVPAAGLYPSFSGTPRTGPLNTLVTFTDQTYTNDPGGVTSYAWDVDGDLVTDYTTQNCQHTYTTEGNKNVTLTVTSALYGTQSLTRNAYVVIDAVDASFTTAILPGFVVTFNDTSTGSPTTWAWDFTNDGIVDSTSQNTAFIYPGPGAYTCRLTVTDAFSNDTTTTTLGIGIIPLPNFGSTYTGAVRGLWFQAPTRFSIVSAKVPDETNNGTQNVAIFRLAAAPPAYSATATGGLEFFATGQPSANSLPCVVSFDAGEYVGVLGQCGTTSGLTSYATPAGPFASSVLGQPCTLTRFGTQYTLFTSGSSFAYPYWQEVAGAVGRVILGVTACAAIPYGAGSPSGIGPAAPTMKGTALPYVGQIAQLQVTQNDASALQLMVAGFGRASISVPPFGTILLGSVDFIDVMNGGAPVGPGNTTYSFAVPNNPSLVGASVNWQNANIVVPTGQFSLSNGVEWWVDL